jgi:glycosidase
LQPSFTKEPRVILFELNARLYKKSLDQLAEEHLPRLAALGFDWIWLMGIWRMGPAGVVLSRKYAPDFEGSPYAIAAYEVDPLLGGEAALRAFVARAHAAGIKVMADFVPNHLAFDTPLIDEDPGMVIHSNPSLRREVETDYYEHPKGRLAHGKDPYFAGWNDTVQLDYAYPKLRAHQVSELQRIARLVDGVRCDMAMLVLREHVKNNWFPAVDQAAFDAAYPREFWDEAVTAVRAERPDFVFMAEVYWDNEPRLQALGFDFTYDKKLYDLLAHHAPPGETAAQLASLPASYLARSVHFLENHDEERAATRFGRRARPSAVLSYAIPGAVFIHQGQMEGFTEKLPVQRRIPLVKEAPDTALRGFYERLLAIVRRPVFRDGELAVLGAEGEVILALRRRGDERVLIGANPCGHRPEKSPALTIPLEQLGQKAGEALRAVDLWTGAAIPVTTSASAIDFAEGAVASWTENHAFLIELT